MSNDTSVLDSIVQAAEARPSELDETRLGEVAQLANNQLLLELRKAELEAELREVGQKLQELSTQTLPEALDELGLAELTLTDGTRLTLSPFYSCSVKDGSAASAMDWLKAHDYSDVIKTEVLVPFDKGDVKAAEQLKRRLIKELKEKRATVVYGVHPQTLKRVARELHEAGESLPSDHFNIFIGRVAKLKKKA